MSNKSDLKDHKVYLDGVAPVRVIAHGEHFHILKASSAVTLKFDERVQYERVQGQGGDVPKGFKEVWLSSAAPQHVVIALGYGRVRDNTTSINSANIQATIENANINNHLPIVTCIAGQATLIAPADVNRKELRINVDSEQPNGIFIGGAGIGANQGGFIDIGVTDYVPTKGALYAFVVGEDVDVNLLSLGVV